MSMTILVTGATGRQGGAVIKALQGTDFEILALTRSASSPAAAKLERTYPQVKLLEGDQDDVPAIFDAAKKLTANPIWGVFNVQAKVTGPDKSIEEAQGKAMIDGSLAAGVQFFVYSSVDRGTAQTATAVPHWASKHNIEKYLESRTTGSYMEYTILRPTAFMEGFTNDFMGKAMASMWQQALPNDKRFQMVATKDIGWFAADAFKHPTEYSGRATSLAGSELTFDEANAIFKQKIGTDMPSTFGIVSHLLLKTVKDVGLIFKFLKKEGNSADVKELKSRHPGLTDFGTWLETESPFRR
ncbi:NmrA-like family protein [Dendryphion nanum]|uniref:NmrA-like family protein n=1 Tax=Dendryphion nanum TaxID=256645 RepID=A0A9P9DLU4_9PLEO|nr:NmrA-like family protein [Dendryphion nanum]